MYKIILLYDIVNLSWTLGFSQSREELAACCRNEWGSVSLSAKGLHGITDHLPLRS